MSAPLQRSGQGSEALQYSTGDVEIHGFVQIEESITYVKASYHASTKKRTYDVYVCNSKSDDRDSQVVYGYWQCPIGN